jgi:hypothetical protein
MLVKDQWRDRWFLLLSNISDTLMIFMIEFGDFKRVRKALKDEPFFAPRSYTGF